jgi:hypothetical protein
MQRFGECEVMKTMELIFYAQEHLRPDWRVDLEGEAFQRFLAELVADMERYSIELRCRNTDGFTIAINSYADLLNAVRVSSPADNLTNVCIGHVIGKSEHLDLTEDIRKAVTRIAFAPEMVAPDEQNRRVCHNCGCGC